jgi:hypothetical protein
LCIVHKSILAFPYPRIASFLIQETFDFLNSAPSESPSESPTTQPTLLTMDNLDPFFFASRTFPCQGSTLPFWRTELHELDSHHSTEQLPESCDVLIIGGGYAGIAAAYHLLCGDESSTSPKPSIVLAEARQACSGVTARNGLSTPTSHHHCKKTNSLL